MSQEVSNNNSNSTIDLLADLDKIKKDGERLAKDSLDFETIQNQYIIERIINVLDDNIEKLKITSIMPYLLENQIELNKYLSSSDLDKLYEYSETYLTYQKCSSNQKFIKTDFSDINIKILKAIDIIYSNKLIRHNLINYLKNIPLENMNLIKAMESNRNIAENKLKTSAVTKIAIERLIHHIFHSNEKLKKQVKELKGQLDKKEINTKWKVIGKQAVVKKYQEDLAFKKWENSIKVKKLIVRSNDEMENIFSSYEDKQQNLIEKLNKMKEYYNELLNISLARDKELRIKKNEYIQNLQNLLAKYDTEMLERIDTHEKLVEQKLAKEKELNDFMIEFNNQEIKYQTLYTKMLEEKNQAQQEKMLMFMMNRAACTIQRYWRQFVKARKKKRGKSKGKGRGKKK